MPTGGAGIWSPVRAPRWAWQYWVPRVVLLVAALVGVALAPWGSSRWYDKVLAVLFSVVIIRVALRAVTSVLVRRLITLLTAGGTGYVLFREPLPNHAGSAALVAITAYLLYRHHGGSIRPRFLGVPRSDVVSAATGMVDGTSDEAERLADSMDQLWGSTERGGPRHGQRGAHASGSGARGEFTPEPNQHIPIPLFDTRDGHALDALVRFSNFWGWGRNDARRTPRGMAIRLVGPSSAGAAERPASIDFVLLDAKRFPVNSRDDLYGLIVRFRAWPRIIGFWLVDRVGGWALVRTVKYRRPVSYLTRTYHSINTFEWLATPVRFVARPRQREPWLSPHLGDRNWRLDHDLQRRLSSGQSAEFDIGYYSGGGLPGWVLLDPRRAWPRWMSYHQLGTLRLSEYVAVDRIDTMCFDPHNLPPGVEPSNEEILMARRAAHSSSRRRRCPI